MPCMDGGPSREQIEDERNAQKALCAALRRLEQLGDGIDKLDYEEAGITKKWLEYWWDRHQREDAERKRWEQEKVARERIKAKAYKKLSPEELDVLGLK